MRLQTPYDTSYATCAYTHAWFRIMSPELDPDEVTALLDVVPSRVQRKGDVVPAKLDKVLSRAGWFLSTKGVLDSKDSRHHLDWILDHLKGRQAALSKLHDRGYLIDLCVRWDSKTGDGGPTLSPKQMCELADLDIEIWFDVYLD